MTVGAYASATDTGRKRRRNEDAYVVAPPLFAVADGMGGAQAGEVASRLAATALAEIDPRTLTDTTGLVALIQEANRRVYERASADPTTSGMGTTITVAVVEGDAVVIGHVGDSRAYLVRESRMEQLTDDHSLVNELVKSGKLTPEEAEAHPQRSVITRAVGTDPDVDVDAFAVEARDGDVFLLCSDGLTDMVADEDILEFVARNLDDLDRLAKLLVSAANRSGGEDNITVVAFRIAPAGEATAQMGVLSDPANEDTLVGADGPAAADTVVIPPARVEEALRASARAGTETEMAPRRRADTGARVRVALTTVGLLVVAVVLLVWGLLR